MQELQRTTHHTPANYRIGLALSAAVLVHTLLLSGFPSPIQQPDDTRHSVRFELVSPGATVSPALAASTSSEAPSSRNPRFEMPPTTNQSAPSTSETIVTKSERKITESEPPAREKISQPQREQVPAEPTTSPSTQESQARQSPASVATRSGSQAPRIEAEPQANVTQVTESPSEQDPYLIRLAVHLSHELQRLRVPAINQLSETVAMEIELQLLENGALTRARILKSTGIKIIDDAAYRASLAASPYPEPPANDENQNRFEVELVFSPKRL
ncbi:energy transducer TonB [Marinobacter sp. F4206]|uniref:energy transducer TonB n=1 Tax=Marinobacter sp. F4206 TaxID=2861777 RepID=UPI001C60644E|nr:energy transducer TonB [Marinobacter sp. F4206]MBW4935757.1 TonB family protein [Marinobacter sp. F4206]